ncbi:hypothetical protein L210DRAFT_3653467 [Boletus edulis BED1]|uniref:Uncharacterized protein n=1 Tax=Boletus edulis BED1 TaxID=1328754 RepID=A0AAD4G8B0_BOLED|nr:hypothetical protein L210DRAFT_3653467 [Boletus edulis BED1]
MKYQNFPAVNVLFHPNNEKNDLYTFHNDTGQPKKKVMFMGEVAFKARCKAIKSAIWAKELILDHLMCCLTAAAKMEDKEEATAERKQVESEIKKMKEATLAFETLLADVTRDWTVEEN